MSISAFSAPSGGYQTITATSNVPHRERARPYWTLHTVGNLSAVFALILAIVLPLLWYGYDVDPLLRGMALCAIAVLALIKAQVTVASRAAAEEGARTRAHFDRSEMWHQIRQELRVVAAAVSSERAKLAAIDDDLRTRFDTQGRTYTELLDQACRDIADKVDEVAQMPNPAALAERYAALGETLAERVAAVEGVLDRLREVEERWAVPAPRANGHDHGEEPPNGDGGELVAMPNSRAFQLGREVERRRWERPNGDS